MHDKWSYKGANTHTYTCLHEQYVAHIYCVHICMFTHTYIFTNREQYLSTFKPNTDTLPVGLLMSFVTAPTCFAPPWTRTAANTDSLHLNGNRTLHDMVEAHYQVLLTWLGYAGAIYNIYAVEVKYAEGFGHVYGPSSAAATAPPYYMYIHTLFMTHTHTCTHTHTHTHTHTQRGPSHPAAAAEVLHI